MIKFFKSASHGSDFECCHTSINPSYNFQSSSRIIKEFYKKESVRFIKSKFSYWFQASSDPSNSNSKSNTFEKEEPSGSSGFQNLQSERVDRAERSDQLSSNAASVLSVRDQVSSMTVSKCHLQKNLFTISFKWGFMWVAYCPFHWRKSNVLALFYFEPNIWEVDV